MAVLRSHYIHTDYHTIANNLRLLNANISPLPITAVPSSGENVKFYVTSFTFLGNLLMFSEKLPRRDFSLDSVFDAAFSERFHWESFTNFRVASGT